MLVGVESSSTGGVNEINPIPLRYNKANNKCV